MKSNFTIQCTVLLFIACVVAILHPVQTWRMERSIRENIRSTSCPSGNDLLRYDETRRKCYEAGSKGPCGKNMIFYTVAANERFGTCDCAYAHEPRTLIYHPSTNQCYFVFQQGYCRSGQWLTFNTKTKQPMCERNPCVSIGPPSLLGTYVLYEGTCVPLNSPCNNNGGVVKFIPGFIRPRCTVSSASSQAVGAPVQGCAPGSYKAHNGKCVPIFEW